MCCSLVAVCGGGLFVLCVLCFELLCSALILRRICLLVRCWCAGVCLFVCDSACGVLVCLHGCMYVGLCACLCMCDCFVCVRELVRFGWFACVCCVV